MDDCDQGLGRVVRRLGVERSLERSEAGDLVGHSTDLGRGVGRDLSLGNHVLAPDVLGGVLLLGLDVLKDRKSKRRSSQLVRNTSGDERAGRTRHSVFSRTMTMSMGLPGAPKT